MDIYIRMRNNFATSLFQRGNVMNHHMNGRGRMQMINWIDAPDDVYFVATEATR
jgi:hypothetical protein